MSELINKSPAATEAYDSECPECGSEEVRRSSTFEVSELPTVSLWCDDCGYGWLEDA